MQSLRLIQSTLFVPLSQCLCQGRRPVSRRRGNDRDWNADGNLSNRSQAAHQSGRKAEPLWPNFPVESCHSKLRHCSARLRWSARSRESRLNRSLIRPGSWTRHSVMHQPATALVTVTSGYFSSVGHSAGRPVSWMTAHSPIISRESTANTQRLANDR